MNGNIVELYEQELSKKAKVYPCYTNRASEIGHPCFRYLYYCRLNWKDRKPADLSKLLVFEEGKLQEWKVIKDLQDCGIRIWAQGFSFGDEEFFKKHQISGTLDGKIDIDNKRLPLEIKSMSPYIFGSINSVEDMTKNRNFWIQKYPAQMMIYLLGCDTDEGIFLIKNKSTGKIKQITINLDYDFAEELIKKADYINDCISSTKIPLPINDDNICSKCDFSHLCMPDRDFGKTEIFDMQEVKAMLDRREELLQAVKELDNIKENLKLFQDKPDVIISGEYRITGKWIVKKEYTVKAIKYWQSKITKLDKKNDK